MIKGLHCNFVLFSRFIPSSIRILVVHSNLLVLHTQTALCNRYISPRIPIAAAAEKVTGLSKSGSKLVNGILVQAEPHDLFSWIEKYSHVFLVAHNGRIFDFVVLATACKACDMLSNLSAVTGFSDSLAAFRFMFQKTKSHKQVDLAHELLGKDYDAHNAEADVSCVSELVSSVLYSDPQCLLSKSFLPKDILYSLDSNKQNNYTKIRSKKLGPGPMFTK